MACFCHSLHVSVRHHSAFINAQYKQHLAFNSSVSSQITTVYITGQWVGGWGGGVGDWITNQDDDIGGEHQCPWRGLGVTNISPPGCQDVSPQHESRCCRTGSCHLKDMRADNNHRWLLKRSCKLIATHSCWVERRQRPATVRDRLGWINHLYRALLKLPGECSNSAQAWHATNMGVNTRRNNTLQKAWSRFYCLWEFTQQQLMVFHFKFYWAIKWHVSSSPWYFRTFKCNRSDFNLQVSVCL